MFHRAFTFHVIFVTLFILNSVVPAFAQNNSDSTKEYAIGERVLLPAPMGFDDSLLGSGFGPNLEEFKPGTVDQYVRAYPNSGEGDGPGKVRQFAESRFRGYVELIQNRFQFSANANYFVVNVSASLDMQKRYLVYTVFFVDSVSRLNISGLRPTGDATFAPVEIYYGWTLSYIIEGNAASFTAEVGAKFVSWGGSLKTFAEQNNLKITIDARGLRFKGGDPKDIPISQDSTQLANLFERSNPNEHRIPIFVNYLALKSLKVDLINWSERRIPYSEGGWFGPIYWESVGWVFHDGGGVRVKRLATLGPAYRAGLRENDRIIEVDGVVVRDPSAIVDKLRKLFIGDILRLKVVRGNEDNNNGAFFINVEIEKKISYPEGGFIGIAASDASGGGIDVKTVVAGSQAEIGGIKAGDKIEKIRRLFQDNGAFLITNKEQWTQFISQTSVGDVLIFTVIRDGRSFEIKVNVGMRPDETTDGFMRRGRESFAARDWAAASLAFSRVIELEPRNVIALFNRGAAKMNAGDARDAIADFTSVIQLNPRFQNAAYNLALCYYRIEEYSSAVEGFTTAIALDPNKVEAYQLRGSSRFKQREYALAIPDFDSVVRLSPSNWDAYFSRGASKINLGNRAEGLADWQQAYRLAPNEEKRHLIAESLRKFGGEVPR